MGRTVDQEVHAAFVEFRAKEDDKVRDCVFRNISTHRILLYQTKHAFVTDIPYVVSLRPVYLLPADSGKEYLSSEATSPRVSRSPRSSQCPSAAVSSSWPQWHRPCQRLSRNSKWTSCHSPRTWPWASGGHVAQHKRTDDVQRRQPSYCRDADAAAEYVEPSSIADAGCYRSTSRFLGRTSTPAASCSYSQVF